MCKRGILLEDLIDYVETQSGYKDLRGDTGIKMEDPAGWKPPNSDDPATDGKYNAFYWNGEVARYYYPGFYENSKTFNPAADYVKVENGIRVPNVLSMVGYYKNNVGGSVEDCLANADTDRSLRLFFGTSSTSPDDIDDIKVNMGNYSGSNMQTITFYPAEQTPAEPYEIKNDVLTITGQAGMDQWQEVCDNYYLNTSIKTVVMQGDVTSICTNAFNGMMGLTTVTALESITSVGAAAFAECEALTSLTFLGETAPKIATQGTSYLQPKATATRAQIAAIIMRYLSSK